MHNCDHGRLSVHGLRHAIGEEGEQEHDRQPPGSGQTAPRKKRTRRLVGSASVRRGIFCVTTQLSSRPPERQRTQTRKRQGRRTPARRGATGRACRRARGLKEYGGLQVVGLVPASSWVGRQPVLGMVARKFLAWLPCLGCQFVSPLRQKACRSAARHKPRWWHVSPGLGKQPLGPTTSGSETDAFKL